MKTAEDAHGFWATPDEGGPHPGVVIVPDVWGVSDLYRRIAQRLAAAGPFSVLVVDQYRHSGRNGLSDPGSVMPFLAQLSDPEVLRAIQDGVDALAGSSAVAGRRVGVIGFCMGGQYALLAACECRGISACAPFYGMVRYAPGLDRSRKPRQPLDAVADLRCPVLGLYGAEDALIPVADVEELRRRLAATRHASEVHLYPGAGHAFANDARPEAYRAEATADAFRRLVPFLQKQLAA
jgi:carboxymethylenebutenolidase